MAQLSYRQAMLMRRMRQQDIRFMEHPEMRKIGEPTAEDKRVVVAVCKLLAFLGAIDLCLIDLEQELEAVGLFRHGVKRTIKVAHDSVIKSSGRAWDILKKCGGKTPEGYVTCMESVYQVLGEHILVEAPLQSYNAVRSLTRLMGKYYEPKTMGAVWAFIGPTVHLLEKIEVAELKDYRLDTVIDNSINFTYDS